MRDRYRQGRQAGVTLVELLVTIVVATIFFTLAVPLFVLAQKQSSGDRARVIAANVAQAELESVRSMPYADLQGGGPDTYVRDAGGRNYTVKRTITNVPDGATDTEAIYKTVTVDVSWTPPPTPVRHVIFKTAIYPQYKGPEIINMIVNPLQTLSGVTLITSLPVTIKVQVNSMDLDQTDYVRFLINASNGSFAQYKDVERASASSDGWFTWEWSGQGAGDGDYTFSAVAVSLTGKLGEYWKLGYPLDIGPPAAPALAEDGLQTGNGVISVRWTAPNPVAGDLAYYRLARSDGRTFDHLSKASMTYIDRNLQNGTEYTYTVYAVDERGQTSTGSVSRSAAPSVQTDATPPTRPTGLAATLVGQSVTLTWTKNPDTEAVVLYRVYRDDAGANSPIAIIQSSASSASYSYIDPQVGWGVTHTYTVTAVDAALNESIATQSSSILTPEAPPESVFKLTINVTGQDALVMVADLSTGYVYDINGDRVVDDKSVSPILVKSNQKQGVTFSRLHYSTYRITITPVDSRRNPTGPSIEKDVELVRNEPLTFSL